MHSVWFLIANVNASINSTLLIKAQIQLTFQTGPIASGDFYFLLSENN